MLIATTLILAHLAWGYRDAVVRRQEADVTAVSDCHLHGTEVYCMAGTTEYLVDTTATATGEFLAEYTGCHNHGSDSYCMDEDGNDVAITNADGSEEEDSDSQEEDNDAEADGQHCHFHAGVEHCVDGDEEESSSASCERRDRDYNVNLRVGMLFVILVTSAIGVFGPIFISSFTRLSPSGIFTIFLKQFGTGVIISTAFVHLFTHASLMFGNECLGGLSYEATTAAIFMAGLFLSFLIEFAAEKVLQWQVAKAKAKEASSFDISKASTSSELLNVSVLEAGIIFHSLLIGLTLVVAGDSYFITLAIVIIFHQIFEGVALGTRIAALGTGKNQLQTHLHSHGPGTEQDKNQSSLSSPDVSDNAHMQHHEHSQSKPVPLMKKLIMASAFALVTPVGMAIGIGVLDSFNGNDPSTIIAIGTLDALSAGILAWVGIVEMWARDWMDGGEMTRVSTLRVAIGMTGFLGGMILMSVLGKWA